MKEWTSAPDRWCARTSAQLLVSATQGGNVVVIRTVAGGAPMLAAALDAAALDTVLGTVAGNDTVLLIARTADQAAQLAEILLATAGRPIGPAPSRQLGDQGDIDDLRSQQLASPGRTRV